MNFQQLSYILAIDRFRHFAKAAEHCHVTQPTLSTMVNRFEDEIGVKIFDRSRSPVMPTETGKRIITQIRVIQDEVDRLRRIAGEMSDDVDGEIRIGIIPTVAPSLLPLFLPALLGAYPKLRVTINEYHTSEIINHLKNNTIDLGILATPLGLDNLKETPLYNEPFLVYNSMKAKPVENEYIHPKDLDVERLWLLEEGHCLRSQIANLCEMKKKKTASSTSNLCYAAGSMESLLRLVDMNGGITILPLLAAQEFDAVRRKQLQYFIDPVPGRQISIVTYRHHVKEKIIDVLQKMIQDRVSPYLKESGSIEILEF